MKTTTIFISLFIFSSTIIFPQLQEGSFLVGGGLTGKVESIDSKSSGYTSKTEGSMIKFIVFPNLGYFFLENIAVGLSTRFGVTDYETESYNEIEKIGTRTTFTVTSGIGPFFRYYYPLGDFALIGEFSYEWVRDDSEGEFLDYEFPRYNSKSEEERTITILSPAIGLVYFLTRNFSIEGMLKYEIENLEFSHKYKDTINQFDGELETKIKRFLFVVGLQIYFPSE